MKDFAGEFTPWVDTIGKILEALEGLLVQSGLGALETPHTHPHIPPVEASRDLLGQIMSPCFPHLFATVTLNEYSK